MRQRPERLRCLRSLFWLVTSVGLIVAVSYRPLNWGGRAIAQQAELDVGFVGDQGSSSSSGGSQASASTAGSSVSTGTQGMAAAGQTPVSSLAGSTTGSSARITIGSASGGKVTRSIMVRSPTTVPVARMTPSDLTTLDGSALIPAEKITASPLRVRSDVPATIPVTFDLSGVRSGEYIGEIVVSYGTGFAPQVFPVIVRIKNGWWWALILLLAGILLGMALTAYRDNGRRRDQIVVSAARVRSGVLSDPELAGSSPFARRLEELLVRAALRLQGQQKTDLDDAEAAVIEAENVMLKWRQMRTEWVELFDVLQRSEAIVRDIPDSNLKDLIQQSFAAFQLAAAKAPAATGPQELRASAETVRSLLERYGESHRLLGELDRLVRQVPQNKREHHDKTARELREQFSSLTATTPETFRTFNAKVRTAMSAVPPMEGDVPESFLAPAAAQIEMKPEAAPDFDPKEADKARRNLVWFVRVSYAIAVLFLAAAGFSELYVAKPTFGSNPVSDYLAIFAWGFGAEATRSSIASVVRTFGLPGVR